MELAYWFFGLRMPRRAEGFLSVEENFCEVFQLAYWCGSWQMQQICLLRNMPTIPPPQTPPKPEKLEQSEKGAVRASVLEN